MFGIALHMFLEILQPLANNIISDDDMEKRYTDQYGKYNEIEATVSKNDHNQ